jgi:carboxymethylenebutenolidase
VGEQVRFASNGTTSEGYLVVPESGAGPAVVVIQEWWGLVGHIMEVAEHFAAEGFLALAPDLFHGEQTAEPDEAQKLMMGLQMDQAARDIAGAASYLAGRPENTGRGIGCVGFCMGGSLALWSATLSDDIVATVGFYPAVPWERMSPTWTRYEGKRAMIHTDEDDGGCAADGIQTAIKAIEQAGGEVSCFDYPGTHHAFFNDHRTEVYDETAATEAWSRTMNLLRSTIS